jgi:hypothetical protein
MDSDCQELGELDPFDLTSELTLESDESPKETFSERTCSNTARGQSGTRWS